MREVESREKKQREKVEMEGRERKYKEILRKTMVENSQRKLVREADRKQREAQHLQKKLNPFRTSKFLKLIELSLINFKTFISHFCF